jgi:antitoxin Phd
VQTWQIQHAKNRLSEVIDLAAREGPQLLTRRGTETAVLLSIEEYRQLSRPKTSLVEFFSSSPLADSDLDLERSGDTGREIEL